MRGISRTRVFPVSVFLVSIALASTILIVLVRIISVILAVLVGVIGRALR